MPARPEPRSPKRVRLIAALAPVALLLAIGSAPAAAAPEPPTTTSSSTSTTTTTAPSTTSTTAPTEPTTTTTTTTTEPAPPAKPAPDGPEPAAGAPGRAPSQSSPPSTAGITPQVLTTETTGDGSATEVFAQGADGAMWWRQHTASGWSAWQSFGGLITSQPAAAAGPNGTFVAVARGGDGAPYARRYDGTSWSPWIGLGGYTSAAPAVAATGDSVAVFVRGGDDGLYWGLIGPSGAWSGWRGAGGALTSRPAVAWDGTSLQVVVRGSDSAPWWQSFGDGTGQPTPGMSLGGVLSADPALARDGSATVLAVRGNDGALYWRRLAGTWSPWQSGGGYLASEPSAMPDSTGVSVVVRGGDAGIYLHHIVGGIGEGWTWMDGFTTDTPSGALTTAGSSVGVRGLDGFAYVRRQIGPDWTGWTQLSGVPVAGTPVVASAAPIGSAPLPPPSGFGFDTCETPSLSSMATWRLASPFTSVGIYIGGENRACSNLALRNPTWVNTVVAQGWRLIPIYVGLQAPCISFVSTQISRDLPTAAQQGRDAASDASNKAAAAGLPGSSPIYFDMEGYNNTDAECVAAVRTFISGWVDQLHALGHIAGMYSSLCSGIVDQAAIYDNPAYSRLDAIWIAAWNGVPNLLGFTGSCGFSDSLWPFHQRLHQYLGGHDETWGGVTLNIDSDAVDGPLAP